jgi:hypothetical protein
VRHQRNPRAMHLADRAVSHTMYCKDLLPFVNQVVSLSLTNSDLLYDGVHHSRRWSLTSIYLIHLQLSVAKVVCPLTAMASVVSMLLLSMAIAWCSQVRWATYNLYV